MELIIEFTKLLLPAAIVLYAMYLVVKSFLTKELEKKMLELKTKNTDTILPIRLQAYERICLFLERMSPNNLIPRLNKGELSAREFQHVILNEIREEFNHNVSQQVYMSSEAWNNVRNSKEDLKVTVNNAAEAVGDDGTSIDLAKEILEMYAARENDPLSDALEYLKDEIRQYF